MVVHALVRTALAGLLLLLGLAGLAACGESSAPSPAPDRPTSSTPAGSDGTDGTDGSQVPPESEPEPEPEPEPERTEGSRPPRWLGSRPLPRTEAGFGEVRRTPPRLRRRAFTLPDTVAMLPDRGRNGFAHRVVAPAPADVIARSTWHPRCPVRADELAWVRVTFWGFDAARHTGELLVHRDVAADLVDVLATLWRHRFPIEEMRITTAAELAAEPTGDGNTTGAFVCRPVTGGSAPSEHAYGTAIDINPFQNPYHRDAVVLPELASAYLDRDWVRPGMILADDFVVAAFKRIGWSWGGAWRSLTDPQHFSRSGR